MNGARLAYVLQRATMLPPHRVVAKAAALARRGAVRMWQRHRDFAHCTYASPGRGEPWRARVAISAADIAPSLHEPLRVLGACYLGHRFSLLGSGWTEIRYGMACRGFAGRSCPQHPPVSADRDGFWLAAHVNVSNLPAARGNWRRIEGAYQPIDWQIDFRSGYRWRGSAHYSELSIPVDTGADVKVPWELGRLQHLPQLALCAVLAAAGTENFRAPADYVGELRCQLLDFLALNPPRFGVNWMCPMDVGIRIANIAMALDILLGAGLDPGRDLIDIVLGAARDHAAFIADHLEWSESGRTNHYLANLVGLLWAASHLPPAPWIDALFAFAATELLHEGELQFGPDGGNYEGSTNYHRLSSEFVLFGVALLTGLSNDEIARLDRAPNDAVRLRPPWQAGPLRRYPLPGGEWTIVPAGLRERLARAAQFAGAATGPDGDVAQIGDTDSGRLFKLTPLGRIERAADALTFCENSLDHRATIAGIGALFGLAGEGSMLDTRVVERLTGGKAFPPPNLANISDHGDLDATIAAIDALPAECRRHRFIAFAERTSPDRWQRAAFADFGLYVFTTDRAFVFFRCAPRPPAGAPLGHTHDDNLSVEYRAGGERRIDPGTFCYTPSRALRDRYRSADAHDVVRAFAWDVAPPGAELFRLQHAAWAKCLALRFDGVAGEIVAPRGRLMRALRLTERGLEIWDGVTPPDRLRPIAPQIEVASGYGETASLGESMIR
jgi:hypothetical protein